MPAIEKFSELRWMVENFAAITELKQNDSNLDSGFQLKLGVPVLERRQLVLLRDAINTVLEDVPEKRIFTPPGIER